MPSRRRKRKRQPVVVDWPVVLWGSLAINVGWGLYASPMTAPVKVRVLGATVADQAKVTEILQELEATPAGLVNRRSVESRTLATGRFDQSRLQLNIFGRGVLHLTARAPIANIEGRNLAIDKNGVLFPDVPNPKLPTITPPPEAFSVQASLQAPWESNAAARLVLLLRSTFPERPWTIQIDARGSAVLKSTERARVIVGSTHDLDKKVKLLAEALTRKPRILDQVSELNVSGGNVPVVKS
jgi:hypothetical protein